MAEPDDLLHQPLRLKIMAALNAEHQGAPLEFSRLKAVTGATDGNLGSHLTTLEKAGYLAILKDFVGRRPRTRAELTPAGRRAFRRHIDYLRDIVESAGG
jgi:DNA-binding MarR family transcriptional regulator